MMQHELGAKVRVVEDYNYDTLGAPFKVTLKNGVTSEIDADGREWITIADPVGLTLAVVRCRVLDPRKLSGADVRFIRNALRLPAGKLAGFLDITPEHYSRCESGERLLSTSAERQFRLLAFVATLFNNPEKLLERSIDEAGPPKKATKQAKRLAGLVNVFIRMKIEPVRDADAEIEYVFVRRAVAEHVSGDNDDGGDWIEPSMMADAA